MLNGFNLYLQNAGSLIFRVPIKRGEPPREAGRFLLLIGRVIGREIPCIITMLSAQPVLARNSKVIIHLVP